MFAKTVPPRPGVPVAWPWIYPAPRLAKERAQIVHQVDTPVTESAGAYMRGYLVATVKHDNTLGIHLYRYLPTDKPVRHRVMHTIDGNGGILPEHGHAAARSSPCHRGQAAAKPQYRPVRLRHMSASPVEPVTYLLMTLRLRPANRNGHHRRKPAGGYVPPNAPPYLSPIPNADYRNEG